MRAVFKYPGAKWRLADWIISFFPPHHSYLEPFFGSGAVLFRKERSAIETVNDLDGEIVNLFEVIRREPERLAREIWFTPYARDEYDRARHRETEDEFQRAVDTYIRLMMGHGSRITGEDNGWKIDLQGREANYAARDWCGVPDRIVEVAERLRGVQIENRPAVDVIRRFNFPNVLIYADPPYMWGTRYAKKRQYRCEMTDEDHEELLDALRGHAGPVLISGYETELYCRELAGWNVARRKNRTMNANEREEVLWMNFEPRQIPLGGE